MLLAFIWLLSIFKEPGKYEFDDTSRLFNEQAKLFNKNGLLKKYTLSNPFLSYF